MFHINFPRDWSKKTPKDEAEVDEKIIYLRAKIDEKDREIAEEKEKKRKYDELIAYQEKIFDETLAFAFKKNKTTEEQEEMERKIVEMEEEAATFLNEK